MFKVENHIDLIAFCRLADLQILCLDESRIHCTFKTTQNLASQSVLTRLTALAAQFNLQVTVESENSGTLSSE